MARGFAGVPARTFQKGDVIFRQGDVMNGEAYLVHKGVVEVRKLVDGEERALKILRQGDLLGELALFGRPRTRPPRWPPSGSRSS